MHDAIALGVAEEFTAVLLAQDEAENGDEIPEEDEVVVSKDSVIVTVPADFSLEESCQELMDQLALVIYKYALGILPFFSVFADVLLRYKSCLWLPADCVSFPNRVCMHLDPHNVP